MASIEGEAALAFLTGIVGTASAFGAKYALDYRLERRRLELEERGAIATTLGNGPGQLVRASLRLKDRVDGLHRDRDALPSWLEPGQNPAQDGYFLRSSVQRVFLFVSWASVLQQAIDALPPETVRARADLQRQYALVDLAFRALTSISMFPGFPGYQTDRDGYHLFTGTLDELSDLGVAAYNENSKTIPTRAFASAHETAEDRSLVRLRNWLSDMRRSEPRALIVLARMTCVGAIADELHLPGQVVSFTGRTDLGDRLQRLESDLDFPLAEQLPRWLDSEFSRLQGRWTKTGYRV